MPTSQEESRESQELVQGLAKPLGGEYALDLGRRTLLRSGRIVRLSPKAFGLLEILYKARPRVVTKAELLDGLWPDTYVVEANLSNLVAELRAALTDSAHASRYIRTVYGAGYALNTEEPHDGLPSAEVSYWLVHKEGRVALPAGQHLIGRHPASVVPIECGAVSRQHARITVRDGLATITDLGSRNGTYVCGRRISGTTPLQNGDDISVGSAIFQVRLTSLRDATDEQVVRVRKCR